MLPLLALLVTAADWPEYRGPTGDGHAPAAVKPVTRWSETENVRWKVAVHGLGWSSPVVGGKLVWVTTATPDGKELFAVGLDRATGAVVHDIKLFTVPDPPDIRQFNSYATPTPALADGKLYAHFGSPGTACLDAETGKVLWTRTDLPCDHYRGAASSPTVAGGRVFLHFDGFDRQYVAALDAATGATVWRKDRDLPYPANGDLKKAFATPAVLLLAGKPELVSSAAVGTIGYDPATGEELWRVIHGGMNEACRPFAAHGLVYLTTGHTQKIIAVKAGGRGDVTATGVAWTFAKEAPTKPSPLVIGDYLYYVNDKGVAGCLDARTGGLKWQERLGETCSASPVVAGGHVYFAGEKGKTFVAAADPSGLNLVETNTLAAGCMASPAVAGDAIYLRTKTHLYCLGAK